MRKSLLRLIFSLMLLSTCLLSSTNTASADSGHNIPSPYTADSSVAEFDDCEFYINGTVLEYYVGNSSVVHVPEGVTAIGDYAFYFKFIDTAPNYYEIYKQYPNLENHLQNRMEAVYLPESVTHIGERAFFGCSALTTLEMPGVESIEEYGLGATAIREITFPGTLTTIDDYAFMGSSLAKINFSETPISFGNGVFMNCAFETFEFPNYMTEIPLSFLSGNYLSETLTIPDNITKIGDYALKENTRLEEVILSSNLVSIGSTAFQGNTSLKAIALPDSLTEIGISAFSGCTSLTQIALPENLAYLGNYSFTDCTSLKTVSGPKVIRNAGGNSFDNTPWQDKILKKKDYVMLNDTLIKVKNGVTKFSLPKNTKSIGSWALYNTEMTSITIPAEVEVINDASMPRTLKSVTFASGSKLEEIGFRAFEGCQITKIVLPTTVKSIGEKAFAYTQLSSVTLPESLTYIGPQAFEYTKLTKIEIPAKVKTIGEKAFCFCPLTSVTFKSSKTTLEDSVFTYTPWLTKNRGNTPVIRNGKLLYAGHLKGAVTIPASVTEIDSTAFLADAPEYDRRWLRTTAITSITIQGKVKTIKENTFDGMTGLTKVTFPKKGLKTIEALAFLDCTNLKSINFPKTLKTIGTGAFSNTGFTSITIPKNVTLMDSYAFGECQKLKTAVVKAKITALNGSFNECPALTSITLPEGLLEMGHSEFEACTSLKKLKLPSTVRYIDWYFLTGCNLDELTVSDNITTIVEYSFLYHTKTIKVPKGSKLDVKESWGDRVKFVYIEAY